uniref:LRRCT domain-containing protein n=1 Tax=Wuchereria bancrofti TaxID=6293 RepID=A0A1I8EV31_WUCBA
MLTLRSCVFLFFLVVKAQRSQFDVNCPRLCHCNKTTVECRHTKMQGSGMFLTMRPEAYPDLDTIAVTGNSIGDLAGSNIFGRNVTHRFLIYLTMLLAPSIHTLFEPYRQWNISICTIMQSNELVLIHSGQWNVRLRVLDMSNLFSSSVSLSERPRLLANTFVDSVNEFNDLQELILRDNDLIEILSDMLCKLNGLIRLHLSGNKMKKFSVKSNCLQNLVVLDISGNEFSTLSTHLWEVLPSLTTVDISSNPLYCDCDIMPAIKELSRSPTSSFNQGYAICVAPEYRKGQNIFEISNSVCKDSHQFVYWTLFVVLLSATTIFYLICRNLNKLRHLALIAGYSKLGGENEQVASSPQLLNFIDNFSQIHKSLKNFFAFQRSLPPHPKCVLLCVVKMLFRHKEEKKIVSLYEIERLYFDNALITYIGASYQLNILTKACNSGEAKCYVVEGLTTSERSEGELAIYNQTGDLRAN